MYTLIAVLELFYYYFNKFVTYFYPNIFMTIVKLFYVTILINLSPILPYFMAFYCCFKSIFHS